MQARGVPEVEGALLNSSEQSTKLPVQYAFGPPVEDDKPWQPPKLPPGESPAVFESCILQPEIALDSQENVLFHASGVGGDGNVQHSSQVRCPIPLILIHNILSSDA